MRYDFNEVIERKGTVCIKWDGNDIRGDYGGVLPMWVADMDFNCPKEVQNAIIKRANHGIFGYTYPKEEVYDLMIERMKKQHNWDIKKEWIVFLPGVVDGIASATQCYTNKGDKILIQEPVYHPFKFVIESAERQVFNNELVLEGEGYKMDLKALKEDRASNEKIKMSILCNPHNPVGRVWTREELKDFGEYCIKNNMVIISDEIHSDIIYSGHKHTCFGSLGKEYAENSVILMAPSKTFNVAGLSQAFAIIANEELRTKFINARAGLNWGNVFGITALEACYKYGEEYLKELLVYLEENADYVKKFIDERLPMLKMVKPEGTYLTWIDMRALNMKQEDLDRFILERAGLRLNSGVMFGESGQGFQRLNIGCPRSYLQEAMNRLEKAIKNI